MSDKKAQVVVNKKANKKGIVLKRFFTKKDIHPFNEVKWVRRDSRVGHFEQKDVEFPDFWSENAVNITASKYFRGQLGKPERESSLKQMISRVVKTLRKWGEDGNYFDSKNQAQIFEDELTHLLLYQKASFNSPVWFNVGVKDNPQCSACFILSVDDDMNSILDWIKTEGIIFKGGSGTGINLSNLRSKFEPLSGGGYASGPVSFMRGADAVAGMIKSGGTTRRAAKMVILNIDHPDIMDFIRTKADEEKKIKALIAAGYDMSDLNNEAWYSIQYQNANNSVRVTDEFMNAVINDAEWHTRAVKTKEIVKTYKAKDLLNEIAQATWECGDPGLQFDTTINEWNTCPNSGRINASNPCSEYMHLDNTACNLASINLIKFLKDDDSFDVEAFKQAVKIFILAQEIIVYGSGYPTKQITENAKKFRELGLGFSNLGALLMLNGFAYDSDEARALAGAIASLMSGQAYKVSAEIASKVGAFDAYEINKEPMLNVIKKHLDASYKIDDTKIFDKKLLQEARKVWQQALELGKKFGYRNSQVSVIAPTGTISFMMDCATTGVEPEFSLIKYKQLVGGGFMKLVNPIIPKALEKLGYSEKEIRAITEYITENGIIENAPYIKEQHISIFDCAVKPANGSRVISWQGHVKMVAAIQPFISGAISKTFNMPNEVTKEEIADAYITAWKLGVKAFAVYRDGSKATQPLVTSDKNKKEEDKNENILNQFDVKRRHLPVTRKSFTHKFVVAGHEGYLTYSLFEDGTLAEIFIRMAKQGSTLAGLLDSFSIVVSIALQYGVPFKNLAQKFIHSRFEPSGYTNNTKIFVATSILDYIFKYLAYELLTEDDLFDLGLMHIDENNKQNDKETKLLNENQSTTVQNIIDNNKVKVTLQSKTEGEYRPILNGVELKNGFVEAGTVCPRCGGIMVQSGSCYTCLECGETTGGCQ
ncbi:MAG: vitamin B12-dependent ribonucleotide reductase [Minisyncoccia bacterium]